jgi:transcriptional regulator with XRE-family HTH domain
MGVINCAIIYQKTRGIAMIAGNREQVKAISQEEFWDDYYACLHDAYNALRETFESSGLTQDELATRLNVDKSLVSRRLNGSENLTIKTMSQMGTGMGHRLVITYVPYDELGRSNFYYLTPPHYTAPITSNAVVSMDVSYSNHLQPSTSAQPANRTRDKVYE